MASHEGWTWPTSYDDGYRPDPGERYWFRERETMDPLERERAILGRLQQVCEYAWEHSPFYRRKWTEAGFHPAQLRSLEDFERRVPVITKADLRTSQASEPPYGDYLCIPKRDIFHIHGTSGTTGDPTVFAIGRDDWARIATSFARILWGMGIRPGDTVFIAAILSLYMGSWGTLMGTERLGATAFPFGAGATGMSARAVGWLHRIKPTALYGTPSYALHLADVARDRGIDPREFGLKLLFFSGEPGASIPTIKARLEDIYGARVIDSGSMAEMTPWANLAGSRESHEGMLVWQDVVYTEVCDPVMHLRVPYGQKGTPIYTHLERTSQPMIRLLSGDLTLWEMGENPCGRTYPRLPHGIFGRIDDAFTIRGENVYPSEVDAALSALPDYGREHRIVITREGAMDELLVQVEAAPHVYATGATGSMQRQVERTLLEVLGVRTRVEVVTAGTLPRTDHKARRVVDDRAMFREINARLEAQ